MQTRRACSLSGLRAPDVFVVGDLGADLLERAADQPRHVHLRDADLLRDLRLGQPVEEAQLQDLAFALVERAESRGENGPVLRDLALVLDRPDRFQWIEIVLPGA